MPGIINPDGTVQAVPPTQSAFAPQPGQAPPPMQPPQQVHSGGVDPGFLSALFEAIKSISGAAAPKGITQRKANIDKAVDAADPSPSSLGNQLSP
jgi:hypothetical protein